MIEFVLYAVRNDSSGGDGTHYSDRAFFRTEEPAVELAKSSGPYYGEVYRRVLFVYTSLDEWRDSHAPSEDVRVWGYRKGWDGKYSHGYVDNRDAPIDDPDWPEFVRLQAKFQ